MSKEFPKAYSPKDSEDRLYNEWLANKVFSTDEKSSKPAYSILMPPPNITGILHFGHILNLTIQDLYIRRKRMQGHESCWFPGTDHAGIATQARLEAELRKEGKSRYDLGREKFVERVWQWRDKYGGIILEQKRKLGISPDWDRTTFTMDDGPSKAVTEAFVRLFDDGLIYKGKRIINWSPLGMTALSDEEVEFREVKEHLYTLKYYLEDGSGYLKVATVRPETIFGDTAVAVNP
ncbi:MAG: class I tRNA ligase family protein, partial [Candidatus Kapaibacterium sp.]